MPPSRDPQEDDVNAEKPRGRHRAQEPAALGQLPPDAAARDAAKREELGELDDALHGEDIVFVTRNVSPAERAAVVSVLTQVRSEESQRMKRVARRDREPWARSNRVPEGISDLIAEG